jgi:histidinol-phosphate aminotransferase
MNGISMNKKILQWIRPEIRDLSAYHVPKSDDLVKLDAMENPYSWPEAMVEDWIKELRSAKLNRYPDPTASALKTRIRQVMQIPPDSDVLLGNGSDELIQLIIMAVAKPGGVILAPEPTFVMYRMISLWMSMDYIPVLTNTDFSLDCATMLSEIEKHKPAVVFLSFPNNPSGNLYSENDIQSIIESAPGLVVIDEAYHVFAESSFMDRIPQYDNLLVLRTVSKMGLAGLRLGFLAGAPDWIQQIDKLRMPYNVNVLSQTTVKFALEHHEILDEQAKKIIANREFLSTSMQAIEGLTVFGSKTNFILFRVDGFSAEQLYDGLLSQGILIKNMSALGGLLTDCLRVTVGTEEENKLFIKALKENLQA